MKKLLGFLILIVLSTYSSAQEDDMEVHFTFENTTLNASNLFEIVVTMPNVRKKEISNFPEIPDFIKRNTYYSKEGKIFKIRQTYQARKTGTFTLNPFVIKINGKLYASEGTQIKVSSVTNKKPPLTETENMFTSVKEDAFFRINTNKNDVYIGEAIKLSMALYIAQENKAEMNFIDFKEQVSDIIKKIKPKNCWSENLDQKETIVKDTVQVNKKTYNRYLIYEGNFYPFDTSLIIFPAEGLKMLKYKVLKSQNVIERIEDYITLKSPAFTVKVKNLPKRQTKVVAVGNYTLEEKISTKKVLVGESCSYEFTIRGEGNLALVETPTLPESEAYEIYNSEITQKNISPNLKSKTFSFYLIFKEPGNYNLGKIFSFPFFNVEKHSYQTLQSKISLSVEGDNKKNNYLSYSDLGSFYQIIESKSNRLRSREKDQTIKFLANIVIVFMLGTTLFLIFKR